MLCEKAEPISLQDSLASSCRIVTVTQQKLGAVVENECHIYNFYRIECKYCHVGPSVWSEVLGAKCLEDSV